MIRSGSSQRKGDAGRRMAGRGGMGLRRESGPVGGGKAIPPMRPLNLCHRLAWPSATASFLLDGAGTRSKWRSVIRWKWRAPMASVINWDWTLRVSPRGPAGGNRAGHRAGESYGSATPAGSSYSRAHWLLTAGKRGGRGPDSTGREGRCTGRPAGAGSHPGGGLPAGLQDIHLEPLEKRFRVRCRVARRRAARDRWPAQGAGRRWRSSRG